MHNIANYGIRRANQQITQRHCAYQSPFGVQYITNIDCLAVYPNLPYPLYRIFHCHILF